MKVTSGALRRLPVRRSGANVVTQTAKVLTPEACPPPSEKPMVYPPFQGREDIPEVMITDTLITLFGYDELVKNSVAEVNIAAPQGLHSVNDPRLGVNDETKVCATCHFGRNECPGHLGYIKLSTPVYHPYFIRIIIRVFNCICTCCSCLYIPIEELRERGILEFTGINRLKAIEKASTGLRCRTHGDEQTACNQRPEFLIKESKEKERILYTIKKKKARGQAKEGKGAVREISITEADKILRAITPETAQALMFENGVRPENMILRAFPVIPPNSRPVIYKDSTIWYDDLTKMYMDIINHNLALQSTNSETERKKQIHSLNFSIKHFIDNTDGKYSHTGRKDMQSIHQRIIGKKGVLKGFLMGKRVNYSARTPISPDPTLKFGQLRIPRIWASTLTVKVTIRSYNLKHFQDIIDKSLQYGLPVPISYLEPGYGKKKGQKVKADENLFRKVRLYDGDVIHRWLQNGDFVIGNRNPTLHKQGFMGFEVVLGDPLTVGLHLSYTTPMNADFDGDEINIHDLQTAASRVELQMTMNVRNCIMNAQSNKPAVGIVYDGLVAAYLLTRREKVEKTIRDDDGNKKVIITEEDVLVDDAVRYDCWMLMTSTSQLNTLPERLRKHNLPINTGRALFSALLPEDFYYNRGKVLIIDGILIEGTITKPHIGAAPGSIIQVLFRDYGEQRTTEFLTDAPFILDRWITERGYTIGLGDCYPRDTQYREKINADIAKVKAQVESLGTKLDDPIEEERRERQIQGHVDVAKNIGMRIGNESLSEDNNLRIAVASGAKGTDYNIGLITGIVGQQAVRGGRIPYSLSNGTRCLPYFKEGELDPEARGFCVNSFFTGLSPAELWFHQAATRETVMESSVKTPVSGTIQDVISKAFESFVVANEGSVRDANNNIIQYVYANDGFAAEEVERIKVKEEEYTSFINLDRIVGKINSKYGYYPGAQGTEISMEEEKEIFEVINDEEGGEE
ncbi:DNA-directed RNA polymerase RPB1 [Cedratvirus kamchatka]|uniref:DNA-directed RNA polymerase subunit n=1 Tax=Cedratvirus kamchatka TaxID=2716914 RepID=A0A6G8MXL2_9VIRU|nr:DNA-directed RNA polymerase RPB1 [Cedratvirus kamchatka]WIL04748.1 DNA-directed RNA polymerase subunit [Cedratvirus duvanny]